MPETPAATTPAPPRTAAPAAVRPVAGSADELLAGAEWRGSMDKHQDSLSGSPFERAIIDGQRYVVKHIGYDLDWLARALGDQDCWALTMWRTGLLDALPDCLDHTIAGVAHDPARGMVTLLLHDVGDWLVPPGSGPLPAATHLRFLDHMARMHAEFWDFEDDYGLLVPGNRYTALSPATGAREAAAGHDDPVPRALAGGWASLCDAAPEAYELILALATEPAPLVDVAWYLAVNCDRLAVSKEDTIAAYRRALRQRGARVIAVDRSESMLRAGRQLVETGSTGGETGGAGQEVVADAGRLPFLAQVMDVTVAGFVLSQVPDPGAVLVELSRVTRIGGTLAVTAFPAGAQQHPVKAAVDAVLGAAGYRPPGWYAEMKRVGEGRVGTAGALRGLAVGAGLVDLVLDTVPVDMSGLDVAAVVAWRLGMAHVAPYLSGLDEAHRRRLTARAAEAVADAGLGEPIQMLVLRARAAG